MFIQKHTDLLTAQLLKDGYVIVEDAADEATIAAINADLTPQFATAPCGQGAFFGPETKRLGRILARSEAAAELVLSRTILPVVDAVLGAHCESVQLSLTQAIEVGPGAPAQGPHRDHDMWRTPKGCGVEYMINVMWALDDFTPWNGATRIWPGSHRMPQDEPLLPEEMAISAVMPRGSACLFLGSTMHSGGENLALLPRRGLVVSYCLGWLKPWENQWLAYPPEVARSFSPELAALVGYRQHRPSLGNYEGQCPSVLLDTSQGAMRPFVDCLLPEQHEMAEQYRDMQLSQRSYA
jgi:ectoine hydroxylase-related dioxygenase (phytanoyl-CoA dioxygenase family)